MIRVICTCGRAFKAEVRHAGKRTKCPECGADLTIEPAPKPGQVRGGAEDVPAWWYPSDSTDPAARATAPTRSGSDPGPDSVDTMELPGGYVPQPKPPGVSSSTSSFPNLAGERLPTAFGGVDAGVSHRLSAAARRAWAISIGATAMLVVAVGAFLWLRSSWSGANEGARALARGETVSNQRDHSGQAPLSPPPAPATRKSASAEKTIAGTPTGDAGVGAPTLAPGVDPGVRSGASTAPASRRLRLLVPAYIYPAGDGRQEWQRLFDAATKVEIVAIANPNSGPGDERNVDYAAIFSEAADRGITLVGYVSTDFGKRSEADIKKDIDTWVQFYPQIRGVFLDQQPGEGRYAGQFAELRDHVKRKLHDPTVITNPGIVCDEAFLAKAVANVTCVFVNYQGFDQFELPAPFKAYDPVRFAVMPYNIPDAETMRAVLKDAIIKRIGYVYVSDAKPPNQWGKLPAYWEAEVDAISRLR